MRVISNTFSLTAVPDVQASRPNLVHCSQFTKDRLGWWILPDRSNAWSFGVESGMYGIDGYNAYGVLAQPGMIADVRQYLAKEYRSSQADYNNETSNYALDAGKWYTLSFKARGIAKKKNSDGSYSDGGETRLYIYLVGYNGGGVSIVDTSEKYIVDGVEKSPSGDMNTSFVLNWTVTTHTITFKTRSDLKTISNHAVPVLYFRSFGEGHTTYPTYFANGGCLFRIAAIKIEEGMEATAYTPHATEMQPPVHAVAFKRENTDISGTTPTGGTYTSPTPTGWSDGIPTGEARLWETKAVFVPELPSATWSKPSPVGDTSDSDVEFSPYDGTPVSDVSNNLAAAGTAATSTTNKWFDPVRNAGADFSKMIWRAERQKKNGTWGSWAIVKVKGETGEPGKKGEDGKDAVTLDLDNQMDSISVDSGGNVKLSQTATTHATIFKGATAQSLTSGSVTATSINGVDAEITYSGGIATISYTFQPTSDGFDDKHYTSDISVTYGGVTYKATFTLAPVRDGADGKNAVIYNVHPSLTSCPFSRTSTNGYSPTTYSLTCGYVCNNGGISTTVANATESFNNGWHIFYRINSSGTWGDWNLYEKAVSVKYNHRSVEFCIAKTSNVQELIDDPYDSLIVDRESVPVVVGGSNGTSAFTVDLDNEMDAIPCNHNGYLATAKTYNLNIAAYLGTTNLTLTGCAAEVSPLHPFITVDTGIGDDTETTLGSPIVKVSPSTFTGTYTITFICKTAQGTRNVVFTLATQRAGSPGESPTIYQLAPSHTALSYVRDGAGNLTGSNVLTCKMKRTTGSSTSETDVSSSSTYYIYYGYDDAASPSTRLPSSGLTVSASAAESRKNVVLELWNGSRDLTTSVRLDRETIPILKDGSKGENGNPGTPGSPGADATIAWLDCPYVAIQCDKDGHSRVDKFTVKSLKRTGDSAPASANAPAYSIDYYVYYDGGTYDSANNSLSGGNTLEVSIDTSKKLSYVEIYLKIKGTVTTVAQTIRLNPVLDGPMGSAGYDYLPQVLGIYSDSESYTWDDTVRQGCFYEISGTYNIYYVKNRMTTNRGIAPTGSDTDPYWSKSDRVYTIFTDALYATNASVGGFLLSDKMLLSAQASYLMTYRGSASAIAYRGAWQSANTYSSGNIVYSDGYFYRYTSSSSTTSKPSVDSRWTKLSESYYTDKYIIDMCTAYGTSSSVRVSLYGYYDSSSKDRPFVYYSSKFWTLKKYGYATALPSETSIQWRELFDAEKLMLGITDTSNSASFSYGSTTIYRRSISKYLLNGKEGTTMMLQPDDTIWTYDMTGKQTLGIPYGKHIEIDPADGKIRFYAADGTQNGEVSGDTVSSISDLLGSSATGFTIQIPLVTYAGNGSIGRRETIDKQIGENITLSGNGALNVSSTLKLYGSQWSTSAVAGGGAGSVSLGPLPAGTPVSGSFTRLYTNTVSAFLLVQKQSESTWVNVTTASSQNSTSATSLSVTSTSSRTVNLSEGTYRIVLRCEISVYANNSYEVGVEAPSVSASVTSFVNLHRFFGNGFAFGSSTDNFFAAINESAGIHVKASTSSNYGFELSQTKGLEVKRKGQQGIVPVLLYAGRFAYLSTGKSQKTIYQYSDGEVKYDWPHIGICKITFPWDCDPDKCIPTVTTYQGVTGVSARIVSWANKRIITIEIDNDYGSGAGTDRDHDYGGFYIKLEYIG